MDYSLFHELHIALHENLCLDTEDMEQLPCVPVLKKKRKCKQDVIEVFCQCRTQEGGRMAACSSCGERYHEDCVALPQDIWTQPDFKWSCASC